jgi:hypothetical protein
MYQDAVFWKLKEDFMNFSATNVTVDPVKLEILKHDGVNFSRLCREAMDDYLRLSGGNKQMLEAQLVEIRRQKQRLDLEEKIILDQLDAYETIDAIESHRNNTYEKWKKNLAFMIIHKTIDWRHQKELFQFKNVNECKKWVNDKLRNDGMI